MTPRWNVKGGLRVAIDASFATRDIDPLEPPALMIALLTKARRDAGPTWAGLRARVGGRRTFVSKADSANTASTPRSA